MSTWSELKPLMLGPPPLTLAAAESLTSGHVQARIGSVSGASHFFLGGVAAYTLEQKVRLLGVDRAEASSVDCVSETVARQMARGACALFSSDVAVATTGYAERPPTGRGEEPFAYWALAHRVAPDQWHERSGRIEPAGRPPRETVQQLVADEVLRQLLAYLRDWRGSAPGEAPAAQRVE